MLPHRDIPVDGSWRMVEGDNDSFDTTIVNGDDPRVDDGYYHHRRGNAASPPPASPAPTVPASQVSQLGSSQGSIGDFVARAKAASAADDDDVDDHDHDDRYDHDHVLARTPFRPSLPSAPAQPRRQIAASSLRGYRSQPPPPFEPEFRMPMVDIDPTRPMNRGSRGHQRRLLAGNGGGGPIRRRGWRGGAAPRAGDTFREEEEMEEEEEEEQAAAAAAARARARRGRKYDDDGGYVGNAGNVGSVGDVGNALWEAVMWALGVVGMAFRAAQRPLSLMLAVYLLVGSWIMVQNMVTRSVMVSLQPLCRIPGATYLDLPFCGIDDANAPPPPPPLAAIPVEFDELMGVQNQFERVLERSAEGVSLPLEMKRSETSIRDLRTLVRHSELPGREELVHEFDGFIQVAGRASRDLQRFNTHVGSAVDAVISINRWTSRYIDNLAEMQLASGSYYAASSPASSSSSQSWLPAPLDAWSDWALAPFRPGPGFDERVLLDRYVEHTALVSERITTLLVEAQALLGLLGRADDSLAAVHDAVTRQDREVRERGDVIRSAWDGWWGWSSGVILPSDRAAGRRALEGVRTQLELLARVGLQRQTAVTQVQAVVYDLERIQAELGDLRDRVAEPSVLRGAAPGGDGGPDGAGIGVGGRGVPLSVHIETINGGVERLEGARRRMRVEEDERIRDVLARGGRREEAAGLIEGGR